MSGTKIKRSILKNKSARFTNQGVKVPISSLKPGTRKQVKSLIASGEFGSVMERGKRFVIVR